MNVNAVFLEAHPMQAAQIFQRRFANLLLFGATATALVLLILQAPHFRIVDRIYVLQHLIVLAISLTRPEPLGRDYSLPSSIAVTVAYLYPYAQVLCLSWWPGKATWPQSGLVLVTFAAVFSVVCLLTIGKRFGVRPALRGLVTRGPYRLVRHPLYLSYVIADIGYNLQLSNLISVVVVLFAVVSLIYRIYAEERVLSRDSRWQAYVESVQYRLVPGVW